MPIVGKETVALVPPGAMLPVLQTPVFDVEVCVGPVALVQVTVEPAVIWMGFGLKHHDGVPVQFTMRAGELAALAASGTNSNPGTTTANARNSLRMDRPTGGRYAPFSFSRMTSWSSPLLATAFPPA